MCGIFGIIVKQNAQVKNSFITKTLEFVAHRSVARGKDSSGLVFKNDKTKEFNLVKGDIPVYRLLESPYYKKFIKDALVSFNSGEAFQAIGHARLVTNGSQLKEENNQPVNKDGIIGIHNGIIVNVDKLWEQNLHLIRQYDIDTEVLLSLIQDNIKKRIDVKSAVKKALADIEGTVSAALFFEDRHDFILATNFGSLYYIMDDNFLVFASEEFFLKSVIKKLKLQYAEIIHLKAKTGLVLNTLSFKNSVFGPQTKEEHYQSSIHEKYKINIQNLKSDFDKEVVIDPAVFIDRKKEAHLFRLLENNEEQIKKLRRCSKCILPETFPFIHYDSMGVCNYCLNHKPQAQIHSFDKLRELVEPYRSNNGRPDCIVPFSGGRDSTYSLHIVKKELNLNPIAFTYDWGLVTDLARRNIARACGKLGVENVMVSANINWKRDNVRKNVQAWLKKPDLGMIPLFMAGDKYFFYYCDRIKKQTGISLNIWGINNLENTDFKTGFAGLEPNFDKKRIYSLNGKNQLKLFGFVAKNLMQSPGYINQSIFDSLGSFAVRYFAPKKDYFHLFDYYKWDENELDGLIKKEYNWETAIDTNSTWRIGDGTASFYNYIYNTVAGFTENDTFRSNQIREGSITRQEALFKVYEENNARYETLRWYIEIIGLNFEEVVKSVNKIPKLYNFIEERV
jgi:glucosamine--fructose-6-phosphate aminotransferase (isomerizing)